MCQTKIFRLLFAYRSLFAVSYDRLMLFRMDRIFRADGTVYFAFGRTSEGELMAAAIEAANEPRNRWIL